MLTTIYLEGNINNWSRYVTFVNYYKVMNLSNRPKLTLGLIPAPPTERRALQWQRFRCCQHTPARIFGPTPALHRPTRIYRRCNMCSRLFLQSQPQIPVSQVTKTTISSRCFPNVSSTHITYSVWSPDPAPFSLGHRPTRHFWWFWLRWKCSRTTLPGNARTCQVSLDVFKQI